MRQLVESAKGKNVLLVYKAQEAKHKGQRLIPAPTADLYSWASGGFALQGTSMTKTLNLCYKTCAIMGLFLED